MTGMPNGLRRALLHEGRSFKPHGAGRARARDSSPEAAEGRVSPVDALGAVVSEPRPLPPSPIALSASLPPKTAFLKVWRDGGAESYGIEGVCCCGIALAYRRQPRQVRPARLTLGDLIHGGDGGESPNSTLIRLITWSKEASEDLKGFLSKIRRAHGDDVYMIIEDLTGYGLPWELLWHRDKDLTVEWLGALFPIARSVGRPTAAVTRCTGEILTYVAPDMAGDRALLDRFQVTTREVSLRTLLNSLDAKGDPVSLVYVACHGEYGRVDTPYARADMRLIEGPRDSGRGISLREIHAHDLLRLEQTGGLVFLNTCHSGRERVDPDLDNTTLRSFAKVFLDAGASGFIGTMGEVGREHGYDLAKALLHTLTENPDTPVVVALRDCRRKASEPSMKVPAENDAEAAARLLPFFYAFMYTYFGNPQTTLRPREEAR
ncbi:CHAT domain-containing protein [Streptosporangium vulgare]|uniref:CHAT domain-containing protein n=1 Tax=Streptosporangium vulgare TaxID=46190 RepID=A0ABV5TAM6_9ACTN